MNLFLVFVGAALINNYILTQFLGMCPFFGVTKRIESALGMGLAVFFVMTVASIFTWLFFNFILLPLNAQYLQVTVFILTIASIVQFVEVFMKKTFKKIYDLLGIYLPMIAVNCTIFAVTLINIRESLKFHEMIINSIGAGSGFLLALFLLSVIREKYDNNPNVLWIFQGFPLALFSAGLMSIGFMGFIGL